jgi:predicted secreted acid phosphatase
MQRIGNYLRAPRGFVIGLAAGLTLASAGLVAAGGLNPPTITTPKTANDVANVDITRLEIKNYYGTPGASTGGSATGGWTLPLNMDSNYAAEAESVATDGAHWLDSQANSNKKTGAKAVVFDVDDTTLTTWNYELFSNWDFNPGTNTQFVGGSGTNFTGNAFPATPGMVALAQHAHDLGYAIFFITGRGDSQHQQTIANLVSDTAAGYADQSSVTINGGTVPEIDALYPMPTAIDTGHSGYVDGLFTKPSVGTYPAYLNTPDFCGPSISAGTSCPTIQYKSGTRAYIESQGYTIVANFGDQYSDLLGGFAVKTFKMPNPNYYLP